MISISLIDELIKNNTNIILTGSYAAKYYGYNIESKSNDIDFLIDSSFTNLYRIYSVFKKYNPELELKSLLTNCGIRTFIIDTNEVIDMFKYSSKSSHINYYSLYKENEYVIDYFYDIVIKIISLNKLKETVLLNECSKYKILL